MVLDDSTVQLIMGGICSSDILVRKSPVVHAFDQGIKHEVHQISLEYRTDLNNLTAYMDKIAEVKPAVPGYSHYRTFDLLPDGLFVSERAGALYLPDDIMYRKKSFIMPPSNTDEHPLIPLIKDYDIGASLINQINELKLQTLGYDLFWTVFEVARASRYYGMNFLTQN